MDMESKSTLAKKTPGRLYDAFFMNEYGRIESLRAARYNNHFSIVLVDAADSLSAISAEFLEKAAKALIASTRNSDIVGRDDRHFVVILPETDYLGSLNAARKISKSLSVVFNKDIPGPSFMITSATFPMDGKGYGEMIGAASNRAVRKKGSIWQKQGFEEKLFWEIVSDLLSGSFNNFENSCFDAGEGYEIPGDFIDSVNELIIRDLTRAPQKKGVLYLSEGKTSRSTAFIGNLNAAARLATKTFIISDRHENLGNVKNFTPLLLDDQRLKETSLTLYLSEETGYALICKENWGEIHSCFHSSDPCLVEGLISKFQAEYSLQEQLG